MPPWLHIDESGLYLDLLVVPRASKTGWAGEHDERLRLRIASPPVEGKANKAVVNALAKWLGVAKSQLRITAGETGRRKRVRVEGSPTAPVVDALRASLEEAGIAWRRS